MNLLKVVVLVLTVMLRLYGKHARITHYHKGMTSIVAPFHDSYTPLQNVCFANTCFAHDGPDGQVYILHHCFGMHMVRRVVRTAI